ncbi:MAG TPA: hypothetical protein VEQ58_08385 [Polyangiaceae bacterium]|nr:hypothetical protein [Polyangiaceae bacterium]
MTSSGGFNVTAAIALVLGGVAAFGLATAIALGGYGQKKQGAPPVSSSATAVGGALPDAGAEVEYLLDVSESAAVPAPRAP